MGNSDVTFRVLSLCDTPKSQKIFFVENTNFGGVSGRAGLKMSYRRDTVLFEGIAFIPSTQMERWKFMKKLMRIVMSIFVPFVVGAFSLQVNADQKVYPGSMGVKFSGSTPSYNFSAIGNPSTTTTMYVDLPAVNDTNTAVESSWVRALDRHYSAGVSCSLNTAYWNNTYDTFYGSWGAAVVSSGSGNDVQVLSTGTADGGSSRHIYFSCAIPPVYSGNQSRIVSYSVDE